MAIFSTLLVLLKEETVLSFIYCCIVAVGIARIWLFVLKVVRGEVQSLTDPVLVFDLEAASEEATRGGGHKGERKIPCFDPSTKEPLGDAVDMGKEEVEAKIARARAAQKEWRKSTFAQRRQLLRCILKYVIANQEAICKVAARDSGKPLLDAALGEVMTTCEKAKWLIVHGEAALRPEKRQVGRMMFYKKARVEFHPVGVMGAIVPWNYPFHNLLNPLLANLFAGNAMVIKASEHASWSAQVFESFMHEALRLIGAPTDLVTIVTGNAGTGAALVNGGVDKLVFVGSTNVGKIVQRSAADTLTPVVLELGGKDPVIICDDADLSQVVPTALRGAYMSCGQNCAGAERFYVQRPLYDTFVKEVTKIATQLVQGPPLAGHVDCGAMCMPGEAERIDALVKEAVKSGAKVVVGGKVLRHEGQFYTPTILINVTHDMRIMKEEVFGPVMSIMSFETDEEAIALANDCAFGLGSAVFSRNAARANAIAAELECGMSSINDFATTYMCQSLPFGGVKDSGYDRFAGIEGLRGCCVTKSVAEDAAPWMMDTRIPPQMQYPVPESGFAFASGLIAMFYGVGLRQKVGGIVGLIKSLLKPTKRATGKSD